MAYIYAIGMQELEDVVVRRNIAEDSSWVRNRVTAFAIACALGFRREFDPRRRRAVRFDPRGHRGLFLLPFFTGHNSCNPVNPLASYHVYKICCLLVRGISLPAAQSTVCDCH